MIRLGINRFSTGMFMLLFLGMLPRGAEGQGGAASPGTGSVLGKAWNFNMSYNQNNNIYTWTGNIGISRKLGRGTLGLQNNFNSNRIKITRRGDKWKDRNLLTAGYFLPLSAKVAAAFSMQSHYLSDLQSGFLNNITENTLLAKIPVVINKSFSLNPRAGYKWDRRINTTDSGRHLGFDIAVNETLVGDYYTAGHAQFMTENLGERRNNNRDISLSFYRTFSGGTADTLQYSNTRQRRDYYVSLAGNRETRKEDTQSVSNILRYDVFSGSNLRINTAFSQGAVNISSFAGNDSQVKRIRKDQNIHVDVAMESALGRHHGRVFLTFEERRQRFSSTSSEYKVFGSIPFDIPDNNGKKIAAGLSAEGKLFTRQGYSVQSVVERFRYDTPSTDNYDDRDELRFWLKSRYSYFFNPRLTLSVNSLVSLDHLVYIFGQRSADNNWNRIFQTGALVDYAVPSGLHVTGKFDVLANYVDYDFDDTFIQVRSFVFRRYTLSQAVTLPVTKEGTLETNFQLNLEENGLLLWDQFVQNLLISRTIATGNIRYLYQMDRSWQIIPGLSFFNRTETHHRTRVLNEVQKRLSRINDTGIMLEVNYRTPSSTLIALNVSKRFVSRSGQNEEFQYVDLTVKWLF